MRSASVALYSSGLAIGVNASTSRLNPSPHERWYGGWHKSRHTQPLAGHDAPGQEDRGVRGASSRAFQASLRASSSRFIASDAAWSRSWKSVTLADLRLWMTFPDSSS